ncbi:sugar ABC transporter permease [bacterium]|nr:sugar ABC transporter permease [bacterium]
METTLPNSIAQDIARASFGSRLWNFFRYSRVFWAWLFLAPTIVTLLIVAGRPLLGTFILSFTDAQLLTLKEASFVGLKNYIAVLSDPDWWIAVRNTVTFSTASVVLETVLGLAIALVLNAEFRGRALLRAAVLIPWAIPTVISAKMWTWMYNDMYGVVNAAFLAFGWIDSPVAWLSSSDTAMAALIAVDVWKTTPFMALLILAGLQLISKDVYEAARIDSDSKARVFWSITLPLLKPTIVVAVIFRALDALRVFDLFYVLTGNKVDTGTVTIYARQRLMEFQEFGLGSAASVLIFLFIGAFTLVYLWLSRPKGEQA